MVKVIINSMVRFDARAFKNAYPAHFKNLKRYFTRKNPDFIRNEKFGFSNHDTEELIHAWRLIDGHYCFQRGLKNKVIRFLDKWNIPYTVIDAVKPLEETNPYLIDKITLKDDQPKALEAILKYKEGNLIAYPSFGKTIITLKLICTLKQKATIAVHSIDSQKQWINEIKTHTKIPMEFIGGCGGIYKKPKVGVVNVCVEHSLAKPKFGLLFGAESHILVADEGQKLGAKAFNDIPIHFNCPYRIGISASIDRSDGKKFLITEALGRIIYKALDKDSTSKIKSRGILIPTDYTNDDYAWSGDRVELINDLSINPRRNKLITDRIKYRVKQGKIGLVLVERRVHAAIIMHRLNKMGIKSRIIMANNSPKNMRLEIDKTFPSYISAEVIEYFTNYNADKELEIIKEEAYHKKLPITIGTQKAYVGMSIKTLDVMFCTTPTGMNTELFNQKVGRVERTYGNDEYLLKNFGVKETPIWEYFWDSKIPQLNRSGQNLIDNYPRKTKILNIKGKKR